MTTKLLANQLHSLLNDPVEGFTVELADESNLFEWRVYIEGPKDTCYSGGVFQLSLAFPKDYPMSPPVLKFISDFWHPNVFRDGKVCMSILHPPGEDAMSGELPEERWLPTQSVTTIILSLLSLLDDPNFASPANVDASVEWRKHKDAFKDRCVKLVEKANRECPSHVVIPHPESDATQHKRRVEKMREMNKELDYDDFYDDGEADDDAEEDEEHNESGDEEEFLESENEMSEGETQKDMQQSVGEKAEAVLTKSEGVVEDKSEEKKVVEDEKTSVADEVHNDKGKTKVEESIAETPAPVAATNVINNNNNNNNNDSREEISPAPSQPQSASGSSSTSKSKKGKKNKSSSSSSGGKKKDKCVIM